MSQFRALNAYLLMSAFLMGSTYAQDRRMVEMGKSASFLVELSGKKSYATAFCIQSSGIFVTNNHVVDSLAIGESVNLVMHSGTDEQKTIEARLIRIDSKSDLALLKSVGNDTEYTTLKLSQNPNVFETMNVTAFGFPFGVGLALKEDDFPSISVSVGKITAVRREKKETQLVQLDATLNPGNSGGAVLDETGEVIGVVSFGVAKTGVNFAIPVEKLNHFLLTPDVEMKVPAFNEANFDQPKEVEVVVTPLIGELKDASVEFWLRKGKEQPQKFAIPKADGNRYLGMVQAKDGDIKKLLDGQIEFASGKIETKIVNDKLMFGTRAMYLSDIRSIEITQESENSEAKILFADGESSKLSAKELPTINIDLGNYPVVINLAMASRLEIAEVESESISHMVVVKSAEKEVYRSSSGKEMGDGTEESSSESNDSAILGLGSRRKTPLENSKSKIPVPGIITDVVYARGGDLLLAKLGAEKKLVVIDLATASITKVLPLSSDNVIVAGTMDHIVIVDRGQNIIERYSIKGFKRELAVKPPFAGIIKSITAGCASQGPILIHKSVGSGALDNASFIVVDLNNFKETQVAGQNTGHYSSFRDTVHVRASADGRVFGMWATSHSPGGMQTIALNGNQMIVKYEHTSVGHVVPSANGANIFSGANGVFTADLKSLSKDSNRPTNLPSVPTSHPRFYITVPARPGIQVNLPSDLHKGVRAGFHEIGSESTLVELPDLELNNPKQDSDSWATHDFSVDKRAYLNMSLNRLVSIPFTNDSIIIQDFDFKKEISKSGVDFLVVSSLPAQTFDMGKTFRYQVVVESNKNKLKFELASGPEKMEISATGKLTWKVPENFKQDSVDVIIAVTNGSSMQTYDTFKIRNSIK